MLRWLFQMTGDRRVTIRLSDFLKTFPCPVLGISAYSGSGKTTLLVRLIPALRQRGLRLALVKHAHHDFDIDYPGKDSYELRKAGASQVVVASARRIAQITEVECPSDPDPGLGNLLARLDTAALDLVLVEGFKHEQFPKLELNRAAHPQPFMYPDDDSIIALITDRTVDDPRAPPRLPLGNESAIVAFIERFVAPT